MALDLDSEKFQSVSHREELNSAVQLPNFTLLMVRAIYSAGLSIYPQDYVSLENA